MIKKIIIFVLALSLILLTACTAQTTRYPEEITTTPTIVTTELFTWPDLDWPERDSYLEHGGVPGIYEEGVRPQYRYRFYQMTFHFAELIGQETYLIWRRSRSNEQYHNEAIFVSFVREFNISREDFERAHHDRLLLLESYDRTPCMHSLDELIPVSLIFSFDNERINEFFRWENSIYAHEVGLPNPLRGDWDEDGVWHDHPNWTENPGWRDHPFWDYLPFNPANMPE